MLPKNDSETELYLSPQAKEEYFEVLYKRYKEACRKEKTVMISECCAVCGYLRET